MSETLSKPRNVNHTLKKLYDWMEKGLIDINQNFNVMLWLRICIDGKQRLTSIQRFMNNEIPYSRKIEGRMKKIYYKKVGGQYFPNTLSIGEKDEFDNFEIVCIEYYNLNISTGTGNL
ncbi:unnamed protein product [Rhizophagus irregularis]|nr:unnamed protein product [Rhizophagus irregularis]